MNDEKLQDVKIRLMPDGHSEVFVDGREIRGVCGVVVRAHAGTVPLVSLDFAARSVDVDAAEAMKGGE